MTLILSCTTQDYVVQVSDRRLVSLDGKLYDDETNKVVVFCGRMAFSYTGLAQLEGKETDLWVTQGLIDSSCKSVSDAVYTIRDKATAAFKNIRLSPKLRRHAFVGAGWTKTAQEEPFRPTICVISNFHDEKFKYLHEARDEFTARFIVPGEENELLYIPTGQPLPSHYENKFIRNIYKCVKRRTGPSPITRILASGVRELASINDRVGKSLLSITIPKSAMGSRSIVGGLGPPSKEASSFLYIPAGQSDGMQYGPNSYCQGIACSGIEFGPLKSEKN